jgi:hypothetical protein
MLAGDSAKTTSYRFEYYWPTAGDGQDMKIGGRVGTWIGQNCKVLDKKRATEVVKLIAEHFPELTVIDARHVQLQYARYTK